ncbi:nicotinate mononucleotide-dependent phosphoribosyltransferase CobT [Cyanobacterium sp. IPPAS B-1200]|uniref:nicotinate mononucleotide-dependent phosphoribosyltransferase CobT n=1 Tax=Cyanobacterium sp. IPPAS B-1200 TaxID=1562720 RepID=UPI0008525DF8|nr:TIGR00303 family protein [Cyanobacterium sp. IPPAS B-1200]OEJ77824.1 TIGR00303 family protein [Cyanobacterium sp. IPPAS B-1200]
MNSIKIYNNHEEGIKWLNRYGNYHPIFTCTLGFTHTALIEGISAAGATSQSRRYTALADAEFLVNGITPNPVYPLPPLTVGVSPTVVTRAVVEMFDLSVYVFNAGLVASPSVDTIDLGGEAAQCVTTGKALPLGVVMDLYEKGLQWGETLAQKANGGYLILSECVVAGTTTALAVLTALGMDVRGMVNSSHPVCNHGQKWQVVKEGLKNAHFSGSTTPFEIVAGVGDPMQIFVTGVASSASKKVGIMLAGGTQMLAVYALIRAIKRLYYPSTDLSNIVVGTTRWVADDNTGDTVNLAKMVGNVPLLATQLNFTNSNYPSLQSYEQGFVKEGVGAGGSAIASHLLGTTPEQLMIAIEGILSTFPNTTVS